LARAKQNDITRLDRQALFLQATLDIGPADRMARRQRIDAVESRDIQQNATRKNRRIFFRSAFLPGAAAEIVARGASERLLRKLGLPGDPTVITELRLIVELLIRGAVTAAAAMLETHLDAAMKR
jgi:hypothetical protein